MITADRIEADGLQMEPLLLTEICNEFELWQRSKNSIVMPSKLILGDLYSECYLRRFGFRILPFFLFVIFFS